MGIYLNPGGMHMQESRGSKIYVDKSVLISYLNSVVSTGQKYVCVSRPRRFGKTMAANMVSAYYDRTVDGMQAFAGLAIAADPSFDEHRNRYDVLRVNMVEFFQHGASVAGVIGRLTQRIVWDLEDAYPEVRLRAPDDLPYCLERIHAHTLRQFVIVIDEWDCIMREMQDDREAQKTYLDFLRALLKDKGYVALAYMTGILPIKKYGVHSALNMFSEFSMTSPRQLASTMGFTADEVHALCDEWDMPYDDVRTWYDGYRLVSRNDRRDPELLDMYSPRSIVESLTSGSLASFWTQTETFEALKVFIDMNYDGLRDAVIAMMSGDHYGINVGTFQNDMTSFVTADDVLTLLVHLGYLGYDEEAREAFIPNREVMQEFANAITAGGWDKVACAIKGSAALLEAIIDGDEATVSAGVEAAHQETSHLTYNDENALAYTLSLGLYAARQWYTIVRELPSGKGFADLVLVPRRAFADKPAVVAELKWDMDADTAIEQIRRRDYPAVLADWLADGGHVVLAGVSYDRRTREHACKIERI